MKSFDFCLSGKLRRWLICRCESFIMHRRWTRVFEGVLESWLSFSGAFDFDHDIGRATGVGHELLHQRTE